MSANFFRHFGSQIPPSVFGFFMSFWPPYFGAGIQIMHISKNFRSVHVRMKLRWYNKNYVGTQFGGSLYSMTDPFFMLMILNNLGKNYIVWDKASQIDFLKPGTSTVHARFELSDDQITEIKTLADSNGKHVFNLPVSITDDDHQIIATVNKTLYVRRKKDK